MNKFSKIILAIIMLLAYSTSVLGVEKAKTIRTSYFVMAPVINPEPLPKTAPFSIHIIPSGVQVELLAYQRSNSEFVAVRLSDGSMGYMPVLSFADAKIHLNNYRHHIKSSSGQEIPDGDYSIVPMGAYKYSYFNRSYSEELRVGPEKLVMKSAGGRKYDITGVNTYEERYQDDYRYWSYDPLSRLYDYGSFESVLDSLPADIYEDEAIKLCFEPEGASLDAYVGCSKTYLESIIGPVYSYAGPSVSEIPNITYALYNTVIWLSDRGQMHKGIVVFYDKDLTVKHIEMRPFGWTRNSKTAYNAPLYIPRAPIAQTSSDEINALNRYKGVMHPVQLNAQPLKEKFSAPGAWDRFRLWAIYFYERSLGVSHPFGILGLMVLFQIIIELLITVWIRYGLNYGSNEWTQVRGFLLSLPLVIFNCYYLWRFPFLFFLLGFFIICSLMYIPGLILYDTIMYRRCPKCHQYARPKILSSEKGLWNLDSCHKTNIRALVRSLADSAGDGRNGSYSRSYEFKYETYAYVSQDMKYGVKCLSCGYEWDQDKKESRPTVRGPILVEQEVYTRTHSTSVTEKTTEISMHGSVIDRRTETQNHLSTNNYKDVYRRFDYVRYLPYFRKYINGDKEALDRYYKECWDNITWEIAGRSSK